MASVLGLQSIYFFLEFANSVFLACLIAYLLGIERPHFHPNLALLVEAEIKKPSLWEERLE